MSSVRVRRVLSGVTAAAFSTFVALLSHVAGGGVVPGTVGVVLPLVLSVLVCTALAGRRLTLPRLGASVLVSQALFHTLFVLGTAGGSASASAMGHGAHGSVALTVSADSGGAAHAGHTGAGMWIAHGFAALVTIAVLRHGDAILTRLSDLAHLVASFVVRLVLLVSPVALPTGRRLRTVLAEDAVAPLLDVVTGGPGRRGPPVLAVS